MSSHILISSDSENDEKELKITKAESTKEKKEMVVLKCQSR